MSNSEKFTPQRAIAHCDSFCTVANVILQNTNNGADRDKFVSQISDLYNNRAFYMLRAVVPLLKFHTMKPTQENLLKVISMQEQKYASFVRRTRRRWWSQNREILEANSAFLSDEFFAQEVNQYFRLRAETVLKNMREAGVFNAK